MGAGAYFTSTMSFARMMMSGAALPLVFGSFILTIVGMVMMSAAAGKQSVGLSLVGYVIFASTFGLTASFGLANYDLLPLTPPLSPRPPSPLSLVRWA